MKEIQVRVFDDLDYARDKTKNEAAVTLAVGLDGTWAELDLSTVNEKHVREVLGELMAAGHEPENTPAPEKKRFGPDPVKVEFNKGLRQWVRYNGLRNSSGSGWAYQTNETLSDYIGKPLLQQYQAYLDEQAENNQK